VEHRDLDSHVVLSGGETLEVKWAADVGRI
jgi:hypothetical protein